MYLSCVSGAASIHRSLLRSVLRARSRFFDVTPTGSVVNRFSGDLNVVDRELPQALNSFLFTLVEVLSVLVVISISFPFFAVIILPLAILYYALLRIYIPASR